MHVCYTEVESFLLPKMWTSLRINLSLLNYSLAFSRRAHWLMGPIKLCLLDVDCGRRRRRQAAGIGKGSSSRWWMASEMVLTVCVIQHLEMYWCATREGCSHCYSRLLHKGKRGVSRNRIGSVSMSRKQGLHFTNSDALKGKRITDETERQRGSERVC